MVVKLYKKMHLIINNIKKIIMHKKNYSINKV